MTWPAIASAWSPFTGPFDFSAKINLGAVRSEGEHLLLLNDDIEVTTPNWIERMVMYSERDGGRRRRRPAALGATAASSTSASTSKPASPTTPTAASPATSTATSTRSRIARNCLAVTGACLMTRADVFEAVGGLTQTLPINFNDIDYCLKVARRRPPHRLRPRPGPRPLRVLEPGPGGRGLGGGAAGRALGAGRRGRPLRQPQRAAGNAAPELLLPLGRAPAAALSATPPARLTQAGDATPGGSTAAGTAGSSRRRSPCSASATKAARDATTTITPKAE